jgi:hypothetical protein
MLYCFDCSRQREPEKYKDDSAATFKQFKKDADHSWTQRKRANVNCLLSVRDLSWKKAKEQVGKKYPGENNKSFKTRIWDAAVEHVRAWQDAFYEKFTDQQREDAKRALMMWVNELERKAQDPEYVPQLLAPTPEELFNDNKVLQFIDEILPGISRFFLCRHKTCGLITHASSWVKAKENDIYRCPKCTERYRPWKMQSGYMPAQMVAVTEHGGTSSMVLCTWPDTATQNLEDTLKIVAHNLREELRGKDINYIMDYVKNLSRSNIPACFEPMKLDVWARDTFRMLSLPQSEGGYGNKNTWPVDHLDGGFYGVCFKWDDENPPPIKDHMDLMREWGYTRWLISRSGPASEGRGE